MLTSGHTPDPVGPGQESVWDYPRPPRLESVDRLVVITLGGETVVEAPHSFRVLETSHPPVFYVPPGSVRPGVLSPSAHRSFC